MKILKIIYRNLFWFKNFVSIMFSKFLFLFGFKHDSSVIPEGPYCYSPDDGKNKNPESPFTYYTIPCKYYKTLGRKYNGCKYLGIITDDFLFDDQCKMCDINHDFDVENDID